MNSGIWTSFAIGLFKATMGGPWQWADGTPVAFTNWLDGYDGRPYENITTLEVLGQDNGDYYRSDARWVAAVRLFVRARGICQSARL